MGRHGRRGSHLISCDSLRWQEVAVPLLVEFLTSPEQDENLLAFWTTWCLVSREWNSVMCNSRIVASERLLSTSSMDLRLSLWKAALSVSANPDTSEFSSLLLDGSYLSYSEISRDSRRTYSCILRRRPELHLQLTRILHALSTRFRDVGYCQGMNFVAGTVLLAIASLEDPSILSTSLRGTSEEDTSPEVPDSFMEVIKEGDPKPSEVLAFKLCERLFVRNHFILTYELGLHTRLTIWTFDKLVEAVFPDLHVMISRDLQVSADFFASSWFITLFSSDLDLRSSIRVLDIFAAKGMKAIHRFGLACLSHQREAILAFSDQDPADALKVLRASAVTAVKELGMETLIRKSMTEFKFVTNQLIADVHTAGRVHGGAQIVLFKDSEDQKHFSWLVVPLPPSSGTPGDNSPGGQAAFEAAWSKDQQSIQRPTQTAKTGTSLGIFDRIKLRRNSLNGESKTAPKLSLSAPADYGEEDEAGTGLTGPRGGQVVSPERPKKKSAKAVAGKAFKSFGKKLGSILPSKSSKGYSRGEMDG